MKIKLILYCLLILLLNINYIYSLCPDNFIRSQGKCIGYENGIAKLKILYCHVKDSNKDLIIGVFKNPYDNFTNVWFPQQNENFNFLKSLPYYPESDQDTCKNQLKNYDYLSIYKTQIIDLTKDLYRFLCEERYKYVYFSSTVNAPCQYNTYLPFSKPYNLIVSSVCNNEDDSPNVINQNNETCLNQPALFNQYFEIGSSISYDSNCNQICKHGICRNSICECYDNWSGDKCDIKKCSNNIDCDEILNSECLNSTITNELNCKCKKGYIETNGICQDQNECLLNPSPCNLNYSTCINTIESYRCECKKGFLKFNDSKEFKCLNIASSENSYTCNNNNNSSSSNGICECKNGYSYNNNSWKCEDIDECKLNQYKCPTNSICENTNGSYQCKCAPTFIMVNNACQPFPRVYSIKTFKKGTLTINLGNNTINYLDGIKSFFFSNDDDFNDPEYNSIPCTNLNYTINNQDNYFECKLRLDVNYNGLSFYLKLRDNVTTVQLFENVNIPFIKSIDNSPTIGGSVKLELDYNNFNFTLNQIQILDSSLNQSNVFQIKSLKKNIINLNVLSGSGIIPFNLLINDQYSTDNLNYTYQVPFINNFTTTNIKTGGNVTIYGTNFGNSSKDINVTLKNLDSNQIVECLNIQLLKNDTVIKCYMPTSNNPQQLLWVKVNGLTSNNLIYFYFNNDDSLYNCNPKTTCSNKGQCVLGKCQCFKGWVGPNCNEKDIDDEITTETVFGGQALLEDFNANKPIQEIKTKNGTSFLFGMKSIIEYNSNGEIVEDVKLELQADWIVGETRKDPKIGIVKTYNATLFNYATIKLTFIEPFTFNNQTNIVELESDTVQLIIYIESWPFQSRTNYLDIIMESQNLITDKERPLCRSTSFTKYSQSPWKFEVSASDQDKKDEIIWYLTTNDYVSLYVSFINKIKIDSNYRTIKILKRNVSPNSGNNTINVILRIPYFNQSISIDPTDYKVISNNKPYINRHLTCKISKSEDKGSKKLIISAIGFLVGLFVLFSGISMIWYIIRKRNLKKVDKTINNQSKIKNEITKK